ncbi:short chain dehydrogenase [Apiospora hydei]|uniref:Short chain dehydrogenase n=1 Tax=Apiospora hydei TaxID=1337664 RepID=A0ABR1WZU2_9PEZI
MGTQKVALVVGASRGIGRQIAIDLAKNGYAASTITTVAREIRESGGEATAIPVDVRDLASIEALVARTLQVYGRLDALVYNAGAVWWASVEDTPVKRFRLMQQVNVEGLYGAVQAALPPLKKNGAEGGGRGRIVVVSPPIYSRFFRGKTGYAMGKVGMSVLTTGLAMDFERQGLKNMAITSLWPAVVNVILTNKYKNQAIESAATQKLQQTDPATARDLRKPTIFSDAVLAVLRAPAASVNGILALDEDFLRSELGGSVMDFSQYALVPGTSPRRIMPKQLPDLMVEEQDDEGTRINSAAPTATAAKMKAKL